MNPSWEAGRRRGRAGGERARLLSVVGAESILKRAFKVRKLTSWPRRTSWANFSLL